MHFIPFGKIIIFSGDQCWGAGSLAFLEEAGAGAVKENLREPEQVKNPKNGSQEQEVK